MYNVCVYEGCVKTDIRRMKACMYDIRGTPVP